MRSGFRLTSCHARRASIDRKISRLAHYVWLRLAFDFGNERLVRGHILSGFCLDVIVFANVALLLGVKVSKVLALFMGATQILFAPIVVRPGAVQCPKAFFKDRVALLGLTGGA